VQNTGIRLAVAALRKLTNSLRNWRDEGDEAPTTGREMAKEGGEG
jgi:hypothetical protein